MTNATNKECSLYLFHLMGCALRETAPNPKPEGVEWGQILHLAKRNSVQGLAFFAVKLRDDLPADIRKQWEREASRVLYKRASFDLERSQILETMAQKGLSYLPLKGILLADYYPRPEMRDMCDNDILYGYVEPMPGQADGFKIVGETQQQQDDAVERAVAAMCSIMEERGYKTVNSYAGNHETFLKKPFFNFEMHRRLASCDSPLHAYYENPWLQAIRNSDNPYEFRFSHEDEYVYMIVHAFKHFDHAGCGVRILADVWAFDKAKGSSLDWTYIDEQLNALDVADFERQVRSLALRGLSGQQLDDNQQDLLCYMAGSGTYGTRGQRLENAAKKVSDNAAEQGISKNEAKARYLRRRLFGTGEDYLRQNYPMFYKHKALRPLFPLYRIGRMLTRNHANTLREVKAILKGK